MLSIALLWFALLNGIIVSSQAQESSESGQIADDELPASPDTPTPSGPEFTLYENTRDRLPCVIVMMDATIVIEPKRTANKKTTVTVPRDAVATGNCGAGEDSRIILSWRSFRFMWHFKKSRVSDAWYVDEIELSYNTTDKAFSDDQVFNYVLGGTVFKPTVSVQALPGQVQTIKSEPFLTLFLTTIGRSYSCALPKDIKLFDDKKITRITITLNQINIQPFAAMTRRQYGDPFRCPEQAGRRDETVPIAVGSTLAIVVLLTVAGYAGYRYFKVKKIEYDTME